MRTLPHKAPVLFARLRLFNQKRHIGTELHYDHAPTLERLVEGVAQSCAFFDEDVVPTARWGYLVQIKNATIGSDISLQAGMYHAELWHEACLGAIHQVAFTISYLNHQVVTGSLQIAIKEED